MAIKTKDAPNEFSTPDLYFAAYLMTAGVTMSRNIRENNRVYFIFDTSIADINELKNGWLNNSGKVPALLYSNNVKNLKSLCHMG